MINLLIRYRKIIFTCTAKSDDPSFSPALLRQSSSHISSSNILAEFSFSVKDEIFAAKISFSNVDDNVVNNCFDELPA